MFGKRLSRALGVVAVASLVMAVAALASSVDEAIVDATAPTGSVTLAPGGSGAITINLTVTGNQVGTATFKVNRDFVLSGGSFTGSNPQTFTVNPQSPGTTTTFGTSGTVSVAAGQVSGTFVVAVGAFEITNSNTTGAKLAEGNASSYSVTVLAPPSDTTPPAISYMIDPASPDGANGWYNSDVTLSWTVTENESPSSLVKTGCVDQNIIADQLEQTYSCSASSGGGSAEPIDVKIKRDATDPDVSLVGGPADGASYYYGFVPAQPTCSASDDTSGLSADCGVSGYAAAVGSHTVTASATDNAGNSGSDSHAYTVLNWTATGFYSPVDMGGVVNTIKGGQTVPLKFELFAGPTELKDISYISGFSVTQIPCATTDTVDAVEFTTTGGTSLRFDATSDQFIQNWQTPKTSGKCYVAKVLFMDGSHIAANFKTK